MNADTFWSILVCIQFYDKYEFQNAANCTQRKSKEASLYEDFTFI